MILTVWISDFRPRLRAMWFSDNFFLFHFPMILVQLFSSSSVKTFFLFQESHLDVSKRLGIRSETYSCRLIHVSCTHLHDYFVIHAFLKHTQEISREIKTSKKNCNYLLIILVFWPTRWMITISCFELQQQNSISNLKQHIFFLNLKKRRSITRLEIWWNHHKLYLVTVKSYLFNKSRRRKIWCISRKFASIQIREGKQGKTWDRPWRNLKG